MYKLELNKKGNKIFKVIELNHLRCFEIKFLSATNYLGCRVKITDKRFGKSVIIPYDYRQRGTLEIALMFFIDKKIDITSFSHDEKTGNYFLSSENFSTQIK